MPASTKKDLVFIHATPTHWRLTGYQLSAIRTYTTRDQHRYLKEARVQAFPQDKSVFSGNESVDVQDDAALVNTRSTDLVTGLDIRVPSESIRSDPFDSFPIPASDAISMPYRSLLIIVGTFQQRI